MEPPIAEPDRKHLRGFPDESCGYHGMCGEQRPVVIVIIVGGGQLTHRWTHRFTRYVNGPFVCVQTVNILV